jgi:pimeloyl-ACP methyl ester carboxylesterase
VKKLSAAIPQSKLVVLADLAHALPSQAPQLFATIVKDWFLLHN